MRFRLGLINPQDRNPGAILHVQLCLMHVQLLRHCFGLIYQSNVRLRTQGLVEIYKYYFTSLIVTSSSEGLVS